MQCFLVKIHLKMRVFGKTPPKNARSQAVACLVAWSAHRWPLGAAPQLHAPLSARVLAGARARGRRERWTFTKKSTHFEERAIASDEKCEARAFEERALASDENASPSVPVSYSQNLLVGSRNR